MIVWQARRLPRLSVSTALLLLLAASDAEAADPARPPSPARRPGEPPVIRVRGAPRPSSYASRVQTTATRDDQPVDHVPQAVTVLDRRFMDDVGARRTDDVLPFVPGVQPFAGYGGAWDDYTVRGFRVWAGTTYRNGFLNGYSSPNATDAANVERIEVVRGPASALYGPGLPGGSINFVTKRPRAERSTTLRLSAGSFETLRAEVDATGPLGSAVLYRAVASADQTAGWRDFNTVRRWLVNPMVELRLDARTRVLVEVQGFQSAYRADPLGVPRIDRDLYALPVARSYVEPGLPLAGIEGALARVQVEHALSRAWSLRLATQNKVARYAEDTLLWGPPGAGRRTLDRVLMRWDQDSAEAALQAALLGRVRTGSFDHAIVVGLDASRERVAYRTATSDPTAAPSPIDVLAPRYGAALPDVALPRSPSTWTYGIAGLYANDLVTLLPQLRATLGARVDTFGQESWTPTVRDRSSEVAVSPRAGAVLEVARGVTTYANVSRGFWPSLGVTAAGNVLRPEHALSTEAGLRVVLPRDAVTLDLAAFRIRNENFAVADSDNPNFQSNVGEAVSSGGEVFATARIGRFGRTLASYAYTDARVTSDPEDPSRVGRALPLAARHSGALWWQLDVPTWSRQRAGAGVGAVLAGERTLPDDTTIPGYVRGDAVVSYGLERLRASVRVENVLGTRYVKSGLNESALLYGAPRSALLTLHADL